MMLPIMNTIVLTTINARYSHASFSLRYLAANMADLADRMRLIEFDGRAGAEAMVEQVLALEPRIVCAGVYIWNLRATQALLSLLRRARADLILIVGGPEFAAADPSHPLLDLTDYAISGEADLALPALCRAILEDRQPSQQLIRAPLPPLDQVALPYDLYTAEDLAHRIVYAETSRGCPFRCAYCLSALEHNMRLFPLDRLQPALARLIARGPKLIKFVDRSFNANLEHTLRMLDFLRRHYRPGLRLHFEIIPGRLPVELRQALRAFPKDALQLEVGIQTWNPDVARRIARPLDVNKVDQDLRFLRQETSIHIHADLIAGLPGEDLAGFAAGFDKLVRLNPHEVQLGILKRLPGAPIARHDMLWAMRYNPEPPYDVLETGAIGATDLERLKHMAAYWERYYNSGRFPASMGWFLAQCSVFEAFAAFSDWLYRQLQRTHSVALEEWARLLYVYLVDRQGQDARQTALKIQQDYCEGNRRRTPVFLRPLVNDS